jgi:hypothetical protein
VDVGDTALRAVVLMSVLMGLPTRMESEFVMTGGRGIRVGAAVFAVGVSLAGPQAVASADGGDGGSAAVSSRAQSADASARGVVREVRGGRVAGAAGVTRPGAAGGGDSGAKRSAVVRGPRAAAAARPAAAGAVSGSQSSALTSAAPARAVPVPAAVASGAAVVVGSSGPGAGAAAAAAVQRPRLGHDITEAVAQFQARPVMGSVGSIRAAVNAGVNTVFDGLTKLLSGLPANQITDAVTGVLVLVRRDLFDQMPITSPSPYIIGEQDEFNGFVSAIDPIGEIPTFTLTGGPAHGSVQLNPDGTYVYTPDEGYTGSDKIIIEVADPGFDLLNPFSKRTQSVTVTLPGSAYNPYPSIANQTEYVFSSDSRNSLLFCTRSCVPLDFKLYPGQAMYLPEGNLLPAGQYFGYHFDLFAAARFWTIDLYRALGSSKVTAMCQNARGVEACTFADSDPQQVVLRE